jgi:benzylsuccinate CoA-transferase BbsF subunit
VGKRPFEGINVLEFAWGGAGPGAVNWLAYHGATVIRIDSISRPDPFRTTPPYHETSPDDLLKKGGALERSGTFAHTHPVKKYDIGLNIRLPKGKEIFKKLVIWANVVAESFPTGTVERLGLSYEELKKIKPDIIMFRSCGYGHTGPMASQPGFGMTVTAPSGFYSIAGWPDRPSVGISKFYTDTLSPLFGGVALMAAINYWRRTGKGQCIDLSQVESGINYTGPVFLDWVVNQRELALTGNKLSYAAPHGAYRCKGDDRWVAIGVFTDKEWGSFCKVIGNPNWTKEPRFSTLTDRVKNSEELDSLINEWTINFTAERVMAMMQTAGVSAGAVATAEDQELDPQLKHYNFYHRLDHPYMGELSFYMSPAFKLSKDEVSVGRPPIIGEHNEYICKELLGMSDEEFVQAIQEEVLEFS